MPEYLHKAIICINPVADAALDYSGQQCCEEADASYVCLLRQFGVSTDCFDQRTPAEEVRILQWQRQRAVAGCCQEMCRGRQHLGHGLDGAKRSSRNSGHANDQGLAQQDACALFLSLQERRTRPGGGRFHQKPASGKATSRQANLVVCLYTKCTRKVFDFIVAYVVRY
jgi:hypothetical protein